MEIISCTSIGLKPFVPGKGARLRKEHERIERRIWHWSGGPKSRDVEGVYSTLMKRKPKLGYDYIYSWKRGVWVCFNPKPKTIATYHAGKSNGTSIGLCIPARNESDAMDALDAVFWILSKKTFTKDVSDDVGHYQVKWSKSDPGKRFMKSLQQFKSYQAIRTNK